ncbi:MAG: hypothetical protein HY707_15025 [Ignavibacteriae bacterium]|nr:hypothetical protein [Ignavibacteriota bacterium]
MKLEKLRITNESVVEEPAKGSTSLESVGKIAKKFEKVESIFKQCEMYVNNKKARYVSVPGVLYNDARY